MEWVFLSLLLRDRELISQEPKDRTKMGREPCCYFFQCVYGQNTFAIDYQIGSTTNLKKIVFFVLSRLFYDYFNFILIYGKHCSFSCYLNSTTSNRLVRSEEEEEGPIKYLRDEMPIFPEWNGGGMEEGLFSTIQDD